MPEECERSVHHLLDLGNELFDKLVHVGDWLFGDAAETAGRLDCDHLDRWIDELCPVLINCGAATGERKAKQATSRSRSRAYKVDPTAGSSFKLNCGRSWRRLVVGDYID